MITVQVDISKIPGKVDSARRKAVRDVAMQVANDDNYFVPQRTGTLKKSVFLNSDFKNGKVRWATPYASHLFYNPQFNFSHVHNPHARGRWHDAGKAKFREKWQGDAEKAVKKYLG